MRDRPAEVVRSALELATKGHFVIRQLLGRGGMAMVFLADDLALDRLVAIKTLHPALIDEGPILARFMQEATTGARLAHPSLVPVYGIRHDSEVVYLVMKYVDGPSLRDALARRSPLPIAAALVLLRDLADVLAYAHEQGVIHRDVKPGNVLLDAEGRLFLTDLGIAKVADAPGFTSTGIVIGTPAYMAPEQAEGSSTLTPSVDQYALGALLYEVLTGAPPFEGDTASSLYMRHLTEVPIPVSARCPHCPPPLATAVARMLAKTPADRFPTMRDVQVLAAHLAGMVEEAGRAELKALVHGNPFPPTAMATPRVDTIPVQEPRAPARPAGRKPVPMVAPLLAVAVVGGIASWSMAGFPTGRDGTVSESAASRKNESLPGLSGDESMPAREGASLQVPLAPEQSDEALSVSGQATVQRAATESRARGDSVLGSASSLQAGSSRAMVELTGQTDPPSGDRSAARDSVGSRADAFVRERAEIARLEERVRRARRGAQEAGADDDALEEGDRWMERSGAAARDRFFETAVRALLSAEAAFEKARDLAVSEREMEQRPPSK